MFCVSTKAMIMGLNSFDKESARSLLFFSVIVRNSNCDMY